MNRIRKVFSFIVIFALALSCTKAPSSLKVTPTTARINAEGGSVTISVRCDGEWSSTIEKGANWCRCSQKKGSGNSTISIIAQSNLGGEVREASIVFRAASLPPVRVTVTQGNQEGGSGSNPDGSFVPDAKSGLSVEPTLPDADQPCTIHFKPAPGNPLYNHKGELYGHLGVIVEGEWQYVVPAQWGTEDPKVHFTKIENNHWKLELKPSIREYFNSGTTPLTKIGLIVRNADGSTKNHPSDQFNSVTDNKYKPEIFTPDPVIKEEMPANVEYGMNFNSDNSVTFVLYDKDTNGNSHKYCYIVGDWNSWKRVPEGAMKRDDKSGCWWITLNGFDPDKEYRFQYRLGTSSDDIRISDMYSEIIYDQWNDKYISWAPAFPEDARGLVSAFKIKRDSYNWEVSNYKVEDRNDLIIYEMLLRDFSTTGDIAGAKANLDYIQNLGVNAVELMPIQEFDGNDSWGYNPNHWFALDKAYGTREEYKEFIDQCHKRGLAVIIDVVYNHATGSHSWAKLWWDASSNSTAANNPWFNKLPTHPYNVFHDINHENKMVREAVKKSLGYLMKEYKIDGFRFDLTKGFTQTKTDPDVTKWGRYDQSRVNILKDYAQYIRSVNPDAVIIFEHLSDWDEEKVLAENGIQLWRNVNWEYRNAMSGNAGNFGNIWSTSPFGGFVGYMESHDEERISYGNTSKLQAATNRAACCAAFFLTVPGPKMIWQFGEIAYDYSINYNDRTGKKPVVTEKYLAQPERKALYDSYCDLLKFRRDNPRFFDSDAKFVWTPSGTKKTITCSVDGKSFHVVGNFGKADMSYTIPSGEWKDWKTSATVSGNITLKPGEFRLLTNF